MNDKTKDNNEGKLTLGQLMATGRSMDKLAETSLPVNLSFRISVLLQKLAPIVAEGFKRQDELVKLFEGKTDEKSQAAFIEARDKLYAEEIDLDVKKITLAELTTGMVDPSFTASDLIALNWLITE